MTRMLSRFATAACLAALAVPAAGRAQGTPARPNLTGIWSPRANSMKPVGQPEFTPEGVTARQNDRKRTDPNGVDDSAIYCLPIQPPWNLVQSAPITIVQDDRETNMVYEQRTVPFHIFTDGRKHPEITPERQTINGHWIGWWEGEEFVIDGLGHASYPGHHPIFFVPVGPSLHSRLRFRISSDGKELYAHAVITDEKYLAKPYEYDFTWYRGGPEVYSSPEVCDAREEGNAKY